MFSCFTGGNGRAALTAHVSSEAKLAAGTVAPRLLRSPIWNNEVGLIDKLGKIGHQNLSNRLKSYCTSAFLPRRR
jgi:hypothetical protein